jgi:outer membrane immunogenic protein
MLRSVAPILVASFVIAVPAQAQVSLTKSRSVYDWSGFYVGHQFGWGWADQHVEDNTGLDGEVGLNGAFFGPIAGFQKQWNNFVLGVEVEANWSDIDGQDTLPGATGRTFGNIEIFGSAGVKAGYAWNRLMLFGTAGLSGAETGSEERNGPAASEDHDASFGWMAGAGIDYALTESVILGVLYRHYDLGDPQYDMGFIPNRAGDLDLDTVTGHLIVKFGGL